MVLLREIRERGYEGGVSQLRAYLAPFKQPTPEPLVRFETAPGEQLQADFTVVRRGRYGPFKILFSGDLEGAGWRAHLTNSAFRADLATTTILVASHHGRENGYCQDVFDHFRPQAVVISDKSIVHGTQEMVPDYRRVVRDNGIQLTNETNRRHVLTTRRDGDILFSIDDMNGNYRVTTHLS